jgi:hypothetical protein
MVTEARHQWRWRLGLRGRGGGAAGYAKPRAWAAFYRAAAGLGVLARGSARRGEAEAWPDSDASPSRTHAGGWGRP